MKNRPLYRILALLAVFVASVVMSGSAFALAPNQIYGSNPSAPPRFGLPSRQGGCNEINAFGPYLVIDVSDTDHSLPGINNPGPYGGCYDVHRVGGVAAGLLGNSIFRPYYEYFISYDLYIPHSQGGLAGGVFPTALPGFFGTYESMGNVAAGPPVFVGLMNNPKRGGELELQTGYGDRPSGLWETKPFTLDANHHIVIDYIVSPCGVNSDPTNLNPKSNVRCLTGQRAGFVSVTDNGVPLLNNYGAGTAGVQEPTEATAGNQYPFFFTYRSANFGGTTMVLEGNLKVGTTLASVG